MSTLRRHRFNQLYLPAHWLCFQLFWLDRTLQHIDQHIIVKAAERNLLAARLRLGLVHAPAKHPISFHRNRLLSGCPLSPCRERQAERASHEQRSSNEGEETICAAYFLGDAPSKFTYEATKLTRNNQQTSVMQQLPLAHPVCRRNRTIPSWHLQRTRWGASKNAQTTMRGLLCCSPICALQMG